MLNNEDLLRLYVAQNIPHPGRQVIESIRTSGPSRRVGGGTHNVTTRFASSKMGCVIQAESHKCELPWLYLWEHDPNTLEFYDQPPQIKISFRSATGRKATTLYTPDFFLIQHNWMGWVECKPLSKLQASYDSGSDRYIPDGQGGWRCPPGEAAATKVGLVFKVLATTDINWVLIRNLEFLSDYLSPETPEPTEANQSLIRDLFGSERWLRLHDILSSDRVDVDTLYTLLAQGKLVFDIERELLAEPAFTNICRDDLSLSIYRSSRQQSGIVTAPLAALKIEPGTPFLWDSVPYEIINVGPETVFAEDESGAITPIKLQAFHKLATTGAISGLPESDSVKAIAETAIRNAAPCDLELGVKRAQVLADPEARASIPKRTLRYWSQKAREAEIAFDNAFIGLIGRTSRRGNSFTKISDHVRAEMHAVIKREFFGPQKSKIRIAYGMLRNVCEARGLIPPSQKTFRKEIKRCLTQYETRHAREGRKSAYSGSEFVWVIDQSSPVHGERPFQIGHIDHTQLDLQLLDSQLSFLLGKPWLTVLLDAFTRAVLAYYITFDPPSYRSCMAVIRDAIRRHGRIPATIVMDQGSDFNSTYMEALLARLGCHKKGRPASKARFGSVLERFFGVSNQAFIHNLVGNNQALQRPRSLTASHDPRKLAIWTLPKLYEAFEHFSQETYGNMRHPVLGLSPKAMMEHGMRQAGSRSHTLIPYDQAFILLTLPTTITQVALVRPGSGIKVRGITYWSPTFRNPKIERTKVPVRYDPFDVSRAYALVNKEWVLCRSEHASVLERRTEREINIRSQEIRMGITLGERYRAVNAGHLAQGIEYGRETEAVLRQQKQDAELRTSTGLPLPLDLPPPPPITTPTLWSNDVHFEQFDTLGDLK